MKKEHEVWIYKEVLLAKIDLEEDKISSTKERLGTLLLFLGQQFEFKDDLRMLELGIPVCICEDQRGWSTCGAQCQVHKPSYFCTCGGCGDCKVTDHQGCSRKVAYMKMCVRCDHS